MGMTRIENWDLRLVEAIESAREEVYVLGAHDCFHFSCSCIEAICGIDLWAPWAGRYSTKREARKLILEYDRAGFTAAFSKLFDTEPIPAKLARRGDVLEYRDDDAHLGVCVGSHAAVLGQTGLLFMPLANCLHAWRIG